MKQNRSTLAAVAKSVIDVAGVVAAAAGTRSREAAAAAEVQPPSSNTGAIVAGAIEPDRIGIDWLQGSFPLSKLDDMRRVLACAFGSFVPQTRAFFGYTTMEMTAQGCFLAWHDKGAMLSVPGACWRCLDGDGMVVILQALLVHGLSATRIDVAYDDASRRVSIDQVERACDRSECCGFRSTLRYKKKKKTAAGVEVVGDTLELGRRGRVGGGRQLCIYDKRLESGGQTNAIRWELRLYKDFAKVACLVFSQALDADELRRHLSEAVGGCVDFRRAGSDADRHRERRPRLKWWRDMVACLGEAKMSVQRGETTLAKVARHVAKQYAPSLAVLAESFGLLGGDFYEWLDEVLANGRDRVGPRHTAMLEEHLRLGKGGLDARMRGELQAV